MGKVIKGSAASSERYTLAVPSFVLPAVAHTDDEQATADNSEFADFAHEAAPPAAPEVDLEAIAAQAQEVIDDATRSAQAVIDAAHEHAAAITADAETNAHELAEAARRRARDEGYAGGLAEANAATAGMIETMAQLVAAVRDERHALLAAAEPELVRLAVGIAERVLHQQIALDPGVVVEMAKAAISRIVDREKLTVRVNPADVDRMREHRDELLALGDVKTMRVIEDQRVDRGGVILETDAGSIDAKISTQLNEVHKILHIVDDVVVMQPAPEPVADSDMEPLSAARAS